MGSTEDKMDAWLRERGIEFPDSPEKQDAWLREHGIEVPDSPVKTPRKDCDCRDKDGNCGCVYHFEYDSADEYDNEEQRQEFHRYRKQIKDSDGFDIDSFPTFSFFGGIRPLNFSYDKLGIAEPAKRGIALAIEHHNNQTNEEKVELVSIEKVNFGGLFVFYATFNAKGLESGVTKVYQAEVTYYYFERIHKVNFMRLKPQRENAET